QREGDARWTAVCSPGSQRAQERTIGPRTQRLMAVRATSKSPVRSLRAARGMKSLLGPALIVAVGALFATAACSDSPDTSNSDALTSKKGKPCRQLKPAELHAASQGFTCLTSKGGPDGHGAVFEVASRNAANGEQVWRDQNGGLMISAVRGGVR